MQDLLARMLDPHPHARITAALAYSHPWTQGLPCQDVDRTTSIIDPVQRESHSSVVADTKGAESTGSAQTTEQVMVARLRRFGAMPCIKRLAVLRLVQTIDDADMNRLRVRALSARLKVVAVL